MEKMTTHTKQEGVYGNIIQASKSLKVLQAVHNVLVMDTVAHDVSNYITMTYKQNMKSSADKSDLYSPLPVDAKHSSYMMDARGSSSRYVGKMRGIF